MTSVRMGLIGLGHMGRHHARVLATTDGIDFIGAVDPGGDRHRALQGRAPLLGTVEELVELHPDAAVVAIPTVHHATAALQLAEAGIHTLIEKPLAEDSTSGRAIQKAFADRGLIGAVGHVERFNPALVQLHRRLSEGELGRVFSISTERVGPFPNRIQDVGVVKDLATHDIDIVTWVSGQRFESVAAQMAHKMGRPHEDLVSVVGKLADGVVASLQVNWLTPTKRRQVTVVGERGAFVADLLGADLYFYANAEVPSEWDALARLKGVSEGDMIRYAIHKPEPLQSEIRSFMAAVRDGDRSGIVSLDQGVRILEVAEAVVRSAEKGITEHFT